MSYTMRKKRKIVYLDQCAVSNMIDAEEGRVWFEVKKSIIKAYNQNKIICPIPIEHYLESGARHREDAIRQNDFFVEISGGKEFCIWEEIVTNEIIYWVKHHKSCPIYSTYLKELDFSKDFRDDNFYNKVLTANSIYNKDIQIEKAALNDVRKTIRDDRQKHDKDEKLVSRFLEENAKKYTDCFINVASGMKLPKDVWMLKTTQAIKIAYLLRMRRFSDNDFYSASCEFNKNFFANIPTLNTYYTLKANMAVNQIKESKNDDIDLERISGTIFASDIMVADKRQKRRIVEMGLDKKYNLSVFSSQESDIKNIIDLLNSL